MLMLPPTETVAAVAPEVPFVVIVEPLGRFVEGSDELTPGEDDIVGVNVDDK